VGSIRSVGPRSTPKMPMIAVVKDVPQRPIPVTQIGCLAGVVRGLHQAHSGVAVLIPNAATPFLRM
jgi:hypothetical protein